MSAERIPATPATPVLRDSWLEWVLYQDGEQCWRGPGLPVIRVGKYRCHGLVVAHRPTELVRDTTILMSCQLFVPEPHVDKLEAELTASLICCHPLRPIHGPCHP